MQLRTFLTTILILTAGAVFADHGDDHKSSDQTQTHQQNGHDHNHDHDTSHDHGEEGHGDAHHDDCGGHHGDTFDPGATAFHHIADANVYSIGPLQIPLPCILYNKESGFDIFMSSKFGFDRLGHGDGHYAYKGYVLDGGTVKLVADANFPKEKVEIKGIRHDEDANAYVCLGDNEYPTYAKSTADFGLFGGGITPFYDFSITKNVVSMFIVFMFCLWLFLKVARAYKDRQGKAPKGVQSLIEPVFLFIQDEVCKPFLGDKYMRYQPFIMSLFFFILGLNLFGQIPFFGGSNVTGNLAFTCVLAIFAFLVTNLSGNKHYWEHIFWMPGVPAWVKTILTPVEVLGVFIKPLTLMLRLFANITAGHMVIIIFVSLIFIFSQNGANAIGGWGTVIPSGLLSLFMMSIELLVAFIQAFVFAILTASYIGAAIEDHHHEEAH
ncbi:MAG: F0F1 ATP synthase subunit A [Saprospiraceae bacterium]|nr:F0F1 ATP synthase subunit A [Saprospiraceae bacterium]